MRILVHDFAGHPFQAQLSRELARRGHEVTHAYCGGVTTGRGDLALRPDDPMGLCFRDVSGAVFDRYRPLKRLHAEWVYGRALSRLIADTEPHTIISANTPLVAQALLWRVAKQCRAKRIYWLQDFLGRGTRLVLEDRSRLAGRTAGSLAESLENHLLRSSDVIIAIASDFVDELEQRSVDTQVTVIENWAPLDELVPSPKANRWSCMHSLDSRPVALYAGTLGLKHDPEHLVAAARALDGDDAAIVVVTEGIGREALERARRRERLSNLLLFDFVPYEDLPDLLGAADVCLVLLEKTAGRFSVPSKTLTYLAAGRPVVAAMPQENLAARILRAASAGIVVEPGAYDAFASELRSALRDQGERVRMGRAARAYAVEKFSIAPIADRIEALIDGEAQRGRPLN